MSVFFIDDTLERALPVEGCSGWEACGARQRLCWRMIGWC